MPRVKSISAKRHRKVKKAARGFKHARSRRVGAAKEALLHAGQYAFVGRKQKRRNLKKLWIVRLNAAARQHGLKYSELMNKLSANKVELDRKVLSEIAIKDPDTFKEIVSQLQ